MKNKATLMLITALFGSSMMSACSKHDNVLLIVNKVKAAKFIVEAELYAIKRMGLNRAVDAGLYVNCSRDVTHLDNPFQKTSDHQCTRFFKEMARYGNTTNVFKTVTATDLQNTSVLRRLNSDINWFESTEGVSSEMKREEKQLLKQEEK